MGSGDDIKDLAKSALKNLDGKSGDDLKDLAKKALNKLDNKESGGSTV